MSERLVVVAVAALDLDDKVERVFQRKGSLRIPVQWVGYVQALCCLANYSNRRPVRLRCSSGLGGSASMLSSAARQGVPL